MNNALGSPPQVRGKRADVHTDNQYHRITPAGAGKTAPIATFLAVYKDHPRRCGENISAFVLRLYSAGSPPQVRGKRVRRDTDGVDDGITPAGAGKTLKRSFRNQSFCS